MGENMNYPENPIDFIKQYSFSDKQRVYTNGSELISVFRVGQMLEHYMSDLTPQQIKDMQFCLREKSRECAELRRRIRELEGEAEGKKPEYINNGISVCRECGHKLKRCYDYCPNCGQAIQLDENLEGIKDGQM